MLRDEVPKHLRWDSSRFALRMTLFQQNLDIEFDLMRINPEKRG